MEMGIAIGMEMKMTGRMGWSGLLISTDDRAATFEEQNVAPHATDLAEPFAKPDDAKTVLPMERDAALVLRKDAGLKRPEARFFRRADGALYQSGANSVSTKTAADVDADLGDAGIDATIGDRAERRPASELLIADRDETTLIEMRLVPPTPLRGAGFERRIPRLQSFTVDPQNAFRVLGPHRHDLVCRASLRG